MEAIAQIQALRPSLSATRIEAELASGRRFSFRNAEVSYRMDGYATKAVHKQNVVRGIFAAFNSEGEGK